MLALNTNQSIFRFYLAPGLMFKVSIS